MTTTDQDKMISAPPEDHRVRLARQRRQRTRAHLLEAVMVVCSSEGKGHAAVIDDVIRQAEVSRGTFYKYFDSLEQATAALAHQMADEMAGGGIEKVYDNVAEPLMRTCTGFQLYLLRARIEPQWGDFFCHVGLLNSGSALSAKIVGDIESGMASGDYSVSSIQIALDMLIGTKVEAIRRIISGNVGPDYIIAMTAIVLRALGVSSSKADFVSARAFHRICAEAPKNLSWWKPSDEWISLKPAQVDNSIRMEKA